MKQRHEKLICIFFSIFLIKHICVENSHLEPAMLPEHQLKLLLLKKYKVNKVCICKQRCCCSDLSQKSPKLQKDLINFHPNHVKGKKYSLSLSAQCAQWHGLVRCGEEKGSRGLQIIDQEDDKKVKLAPSISLFVDLLLIEDYLIGLMSF